MSDTPKLKWTEYSKDYFTAQCGEYVLHLSADLGNPGAMLEIVDADCWSMSFDCKDTESGKSAGEKFAEMLEILKGGGK